MGDRSLALGESPTTMGGMLAVADVVVVVVVVVCVGVSGRG